MKSFVTVPALAAALAFLSSCGGETEEPEPKSPEIAETKTIREEKEPEPEKTDEDAERERRRAMAEERGKQWFEDKDLDGDGALTQEESGNLAWVFLHMADADGDGKVTGEEAKEAMEEAREEAKAGRFRRPEPTKVIEIMDTDGDGMIGDTEIPERVRPMMRFADTDGDGKISVVEIEIVNAMMDAGVRPGGGGGPRPGGEGNGGSSSEGSGGGVRPGGAVPQL